MTLELALSYINRGWPVFPVRSAEEYDDVTGEVYSPKTPLTSNGLKAATLNERIVREWWRRYPSAMVGIPTGEAIGAFVLDLDIKPGVGDGHEWLSDMELEHGRLPLTARSRTMGGGSHFFFKHVDGVRNRGALGLACDIRGAGGYIVAPGSQAADGRAYKWIDDIEVNDAPAWLLDLLLKHPAQPQEYQPRTYTSTNAPYVNTAINDELSQLASVPLGGGRNNALNDAAFAIGQFVGAGAISRAEAEAALESVFCQWDNVKKSRGTMKNGLDSGCQNPRSIPSPTQYKDNTRLTDLTRMIENGARKAKAKLEPEPEAITLSVIDPSAQPPPVKATPFNWINPKTIPRRSFAFGTHYIRKYVSVTVAPGGLGKTAHSIVDALAMASGKGLAGTAPDERLRCWVYNSEDPRDELERRVMAACLHYKLKPEDINGYVFLDTGREQELVIARDDKRGVTINEPVVEAVVEQIITNKIDVMIVDPFVSTHSVNENDNGAIDKVAKLWAHIADRTNCAIDIVHHLRKQQDGREATVEDARGAVSLIGAARSVRVLNRMTEEQATAGGVSHDDRFGYFSVTYGKSNLTKLSHKSDWRRLVGQSLGNGTGDGNLRFKRHDEAPVVTEWKWPGAEDIIDGLTPEQIRKVQVTVDNSDYKNASNAKNWVGNAIAFAIDIDADDKKNKPRLVNLLRALISEGKLLEVKERDSITRKVTAFIRSPDYQVSG